MAIRSFRQKLPRLAAAATALTLAAGMAGLMPTPAGAKTSYTAYVVNDQFPTSNSISAVTGSGSSWHAGTPIVLDSGTIGLTTIAFSPDGSTAYTPEAALNEIRPINTSTFTDGAAFPAGVSTPLYIGVTPNGKSLVATGVDSNNVSIISTAHTSNLKTVDVGNQPQGLAILPDSSKAYVVNTGDGTVSVIRLTGTPKVTKTISFRKNGCTYPYNDAVNASGSTVFVTCSGTSKLWAINTATNRAANSGITIPDGGNPDNGGLHQVVVTPDGGTAYVASGNDVYPVTLSTGQVGSGIAMTNAWSLSISTDGAYLMTGQSDNGCGCYTDNVEVIKVANNSVADTFSSGGYEHFGLAFKP